MGTTYSQLKTNIPDWMNDSSAELSAQLDKCIDLAELRLSRDLQVTAFDTKATGSFSSGSPTISKPTTAVTIRYLRFNDGSGTRTTLERKTPEYCFQYWPTATTTTSTPRFYAETTATQIYIAGTPSSALGYEIGYTRRLTALATGNPTNWLTDNAEDALLYAACLVAAIYTDDQEQIQRFADLYKMAVLAVNNEHSRTLRDDYRTAPRVLTVENIGEIARKS